MDSSASRGILIVANPVITARKTHRRLVLAG